MPHPLVLLVVGDAGALALLERELSELSADYHLAYAASVAEAQAELNRARRNGRPLALLVADTELTELESLQQQLAEEFPDARSVELCPAAAAVAAEAPMAQQNVDAACDLYLPRPTSEGDSELLAPLVDLLDDWRAAHVNGETVRLVGHRWSRRTHQIREFLACNLVPYRSLDVEHSATARQLVARHGAEAAELPLVLLPDGTALRRPDDRQLAEAIGLQTETSRRFYDLLVVGGGPAGLAAAVYGASEGLGCAVLEDSAPGGQAGTSARIENYLGFPQGLTGADLTRRAVDQARKFGAELATPRRVTGVRAEGRFRHVELEDGERLSGNCILLACGVEYRRLECPGAERLTGHGIYYGAARTEAPHCSGMTVFVVGGGNSAGQAAVYLSEHAAQVTMLVREPSLEQGMSQYLVERIEGTENIEVRLGVQLAAVHGEEHLEALTLEPAEGGEPQRVEAQALYLFIGAAPNTDWLEGSGVQLDDAGYILTGRDLLQRGRWPDQWPLERAPRLLETSVPGVFAAGDVRAGSVKRVASAVGEGGMAVQFVHEYIADL